MLFGRVNAEKVYAQPVAILTWSSVADLFLFLRQAHVVIALETSSQLAILNRLRPFLRGDSSKVRRVSTKTPPKY
jgi:hypothetical protein